jgi:hypothetical protein
MDGNRNWLKSVLAFALVELVITPCTKSPSKTMAAPGGLLKTCDTEVGKSVCKAPEVPPAMLPVSPKIWAMSCSAVATDGSVQGS